MAFSFKITKKSPHTKARLGEMRTPHGVIQTPVFMPVGTQATVKAVRPEELKDMGAEIVLGNTYHLYLRPGHELIKKLGGLHKFMNWSGPLLTDSGGYQVFSLGREPLLRHPIGGLRCGGYAGQAEARQVPRDESGPSRRKTKLAKVTDEGVEFQSHVDGSKHFMRPEDSIAIQEALGADIIMAFDECTPHPATYEEAKKSMELSLDWERRSLLSKTRDDQALFAIIQGGMYPELRRECFERLEDVGRCSVLGTRRSIDNENRATSNEQRFAGFALGGLSVGEPIPQMYEMVTQCTSFMPEDKPRYLMGVGLPEDLITCIDLGIDMFDCVIPTRNARNGMLFTKHGAIQIKQKQYVDDSGPIEADCQCYVCQNYSRAYLRHLHMAKEILSSILSTIHNLHYYLNLIQEVRDAIQNGDFAQFKKDFLSR